MKQGQTFFLNQIDLRASITASSDQGVAGLAANNDFAALAWNGITQNDQEFILLANGDGTFQRRRFFRDADWMNTDTAFELQQLDVNGTPIGVPFYTSTGLEHARGAYDGFFDRRIRAIQWTRDCRTVTRCDGAKAFEEEALVELRNAMRPDRAFTLAADTAALRLTWLTQPVKVYTIPVTQVAAPQYSYGIEADVEAVTAPRADGSYAPGSDITFRVTLKDGEGHRLHAPGALPTYNEVINGPNPAGIQYYRAFFDPTATYWRRKHLERMMMAQLIGPAQNVQPVRSIAELEKFLGPDDVQDAGTLARDGVVAQFHTFPTAHDLFGGAFDAGHAGWAQPVPDTWTHHLPADAPAGTYAMTVKGRRTYMGEDVPYTRTIEIQVGSPVHTEPVLTTGRCEACHNGPSALSTVLHANDNRAACAGCHAPLGFELEGPIYVRTHFIHSRSRRLFSGIGSGAPLDNCALCHLSKASIQRTSQSACLSCHTSYPADHVARFGPIQSMYVGGGKESFAPCTTECHQIHPHSGL
ncbi:MAG TPA: hypothetical protein VGC42_01865 [Kofleriaceae bacterium]